MPLTLIAKILSETIGFNPASIGESAFRRAVGARLSALSLKDPDAYVDYLRTTPAEIQELIEAVVVSETWFLREPQAFRAMVRYVRDTWSAKHPTGILRLLSLPCSTGEEPFSMAMALLDAGFPANRFKIDAVDVSERAIAEAKLGVYGKNSFRGTGLSFLIRHFRTLPDGRHISDAVRGRVDFARANLLDRDFTPGLGLYDIIFCRNMLIYFDDIARTAAVAVLNRLLANDGMLFVGPSESALMLDQGLVSAKVPHAFAFQKASPARPEPNPERPPKPEFTQPDTPPRRRRAKGATSRLSPETPAPSGRRARMLADISRIADQGELEEAGRACEAFLRDGEPTADALLLLGLIRDAAGNLDEAMHGYRRALYLEPNHPQALFHLALLLEKLGEFAGAKVMNDRLRRTNRRETG